VHARCTAGTRDVRLVVTVGARAKINRPLTHPGNPMPAPELVHVATMKAQLGHEQFFIPNGPRGVRVIAEVDGVEVSGERLNAKMVGSSAADWLTVGPDGTWGMIDVRVTLMTDDEVVLYAEYGGQIDLGAGRVISTPTFQCGDEKYDWLNRAQFIGDGTLDRDTNLLTYELYEVRST
jgi:hypothetical protein